MDKPHVQECEEKYLEAVRELDLYETEFATLWLMERANANSDMSATNATLSSMGAHRAELTGKVQIARLRLEHAWYGQGD